MGIRFLCPNGHKLNVKAFLAGRRGICPFCGAKFQIPTESELPSAESSPIRKASAGDDAPVLRADRETSPFERDLETHLQQVEGATLSENSNAMPGAVPGESASARAPTSEGAGRRPAEASASSDTSAPPSQISAGESPNASVGQKAPPAEEPSAASPTELAPPQSATHPDPLAESPSAVWYVRPPSGGQFGPARADMMRTWLNEGRVSPETLVWREGWADWQEATAVFSELQSATTSLAAPPVAVPAGSDGANASYRTGSRPRRSGPNTGLIVVLTVAVLLLLVVLIWILTRGPNSGEQDPSGTAPSVAMAPAARQETARWAHKWVWLVGESEKSDGKELAAPA